MEKNFKINFFQYLFSAIFGLSLYFLLYLPLELLLTEFFFIIPKINPWINTGILLFFLLTVNLFNWDIIINNRKKLISLLVLVIVAFSFYGIYHQIKLDREYLPKIYQVKPSWAIQGQPIEIKGINFGPIWKRGEVAIEGMKFLVKDWSENKIMIEAPAPAIVGHFYLYVKTKEGKISNLLPIEIKDPSELLKYLR